MLDHTECAHEATKAARATCRRNRAKALDYHNKDIDLLLEVFRSKATYTDRPDQWVWWAARNFTSYKGEDVREAASAILTHFHPSGDEALDNRRKANGYIITTMPHTMLSITLRAAS